MAYPRSSSDSDNSITFGCSLAISGSALFFRTAQSKSSKKMDKALEEKIVQFCGITGSG